jgi:phenylpropionate dioxygenase-like ring-hydroxylating dioxygenase large terminal subunit
MNAPASISQWPGGWWAGCRSEDLGRKPRAASVNGTPVVLFRTADGAVAAIEDRCAHRMAPLSAGRTKRGTIECAYHGWRFDAAGRCAAIPGLGSGELADHPTRRVPAARTYEAGGLVWLSGSVEASEPYRGSLADAAACHTFVWRTQVRGALVDIAENFLDGFHTHFVHAGLIRNESTRQKVLARVHRLPDRVEIEYLGEGKQNGWISQLLERDRTTTVARFVRPAVAELEYRSSRRIELTITAYFTPAGDDTVTVHAVLAVPGNAFTGRLKQAVITPLFLLALRQDRRIVELQRNSIARWGGERFTSTRLDLMRPHIARLLEPDPLPADLDAVHEVDLLL